MKPLFVLACSQTKHPSLHSMPMPARHAYTGRSFLLARRWLENIGAQWCVLSGGYGFVWPDTPIEYYDHKLGPSDVPEIWEPFNALKQKQYGRLVAAPQVVIIGSALYARIAAGFLDRPVLAPLAGLPIGRCLAVLKYLSVVTSYPR